MGKKVLLTYFCKLITSKDKKNMPAPQGFVSDFRCCTARAMAPTEYKTIAFCFVWFSVSVFSLCTVSDNSIHLSKTAFSWNTFTIHICLSWTVDFMVICFLLKCSDWPHLGRLVLTEMTYCDRCRDSSLTHTWQGCCQPPLDLNPTHGDLWIWRFLVGLRLKILQLAP